MLLVLGFVVIGSTVMQIQTLEGATTRLQRDSMLDTFEEMVKKFNQTIQDGALLGETDRDDFVAFSRQAELNLVDQAIRRGMYLSVNLHPSPSTADYWRASRCPAFQSEVGGVIFSFDASTKAETIVGAVYEIYATDGRQSIRTDYYVKVQDCVPATMLTYLEGATATVGTVANVSWAQDPADGNKTMYINETQVTLQGGAATSSPDYQTSNGWGGQADIEASDNVFATQNRPAANNLSFTYTLPGVPQGATLSNVTFDFEGYKDATVIDDEIRMIGVLDGNDTGYTVVPLTVVELTHTVTLSHPTGGTWTKSEFENTTFSVQAVAAGLPGDEGKFYVDHIRANMTYSLDYYDVNATIFFDAIPQFYDAQYINATYQIERGTATESFRLQVWDATNSTWETRATLDATAPQWGGFNVKLNANDFPSNDRPRFRIIDADTYDPNTVSNADLDVIRIDHLRIRSVWSS